MTKEREVKIISNIDKKSITISRFKGMDRRTEGSDPQGSATVNNFRFTHDGSLEKREGYKWLATITGKVRALWTGYVDGAQRCFVLADNAVYELDKYGKIYAAKRAAQNS